MGLQVPRQVFISYAQADRATADMICRAVESSGIPCWIAPRDIRPGSQYSEGIIDGINQCEAMVLVLSSASNDSKHVVREVDRAVDKNLSIIPFKIENLRLSKALEYYLNVAQWLNAYQPPAEPHIQELVTILRAQLARNSDFAVPAGAPVLDESEMPHPVAISLAVYRAAGSNGEPLARLRGRAQLVRAIVEFLGFACICDYLRRFRLNMDARDRDAIDVLINNSICRPALTDLARCCLDISKAAGRDRLIMPNSFDLLFDGNSFSEADFLAVADEVQEILDCSFRFSDEALLDSACNRLDERFEKFLPALEFLARYPLYFVETSREVAPGDFELEASFCSGIDPFDRKADVCISVDSGVGQGELVIYNPYSREALSLDPLIRVFPVCPCGQCSLVDQMGIYCSVGESLSYRLVSDPDHLANHKGAIPLKVPLLVFSRVVLPSVLAPGETAHVSVKALNAGNSPARKIRYNEQLPEGLQLVKGRLEVAGFLDSGQVLESAAEAIVGDVREVTFEPVRVTYMDDHLEYETFLTPETFRISERTAPALEVSSALTPRGTIGVNDILRITFKIDNRGTTSALDIRFALVLPDNLELLSGNSPPESVFNISAGGSHTLEFDMKAVDDGECAISTEPLTYSDTRENSYALDPIETRLHIEFKWRAGLSGRGGETEALHSILDEVNSGRGQIVVISGDAGVGKTRLLDELKRVASDRGFLCLEGKCDAFTSNMPFMPFKQIFSRGFDVEEELGNIEGGRKAAVQIMRVAPSLEECIPIINKFLLDTPDECGAAQDPAAERERFFFAATELVEQFSNLHPILFSIEDLHWADSGTLDLLQFLSLRVPDMPVLVVGTYRPDELVTPELSTPPLSRCLRQLSHGPSFHEMRLQELTEDDVREMISSIFYNFRFPSDFASMLFHETEGNPLFVIEVLRSLYEQGIIRLEDGWWVITEMTGRIRMPDTLETVIKERLEKLDEGKRSELQKASVIGRDFTYEIFRRLSECEEDELIEHLEEYIDLRILEELSSEDERFGFTHGKIQEVVYGELIGIKRKRLHKKVAEIVEQMFADRIEEAAQVLAHHFYEAGATEKALEYLIRAGDQCADLYSVREAERHLSRALEILDGSTPRPELNIKRRKILVRIADLHKHAGKYDLAEALYRQCLELDEEVGDDYERGWSLDNLGDIEVLKGDFEAAERIYREVLEISRNDSGSKRLESEALVDLGKLYSEWSQRLQSRGELTKARRKGSHAVAALNCALKLSREMGDHARIARACRYLSDVYLLTNDFCRAIKYAELSLEIAGEFDLPPMGHIPLGKVHCRLGNYANARSHFDRMRAWSSKSGFIRLLVIANKCLGAVCALQGDPEEALKYLDEARSRNGGGAYREIEPGIIAFIGDAYLQLGGEKEAMEAFARLAALTGLGGEAPGRSDLMVAAGFEFFGGGYYARAIDYVESSAAGIESAESRGRVGALLADCYIGRGKAYEHLAEHQRAIDCYRAAARTAREDGDFEREWWATDFVGDVFLKEGDFKSAEEAYRDCLASASQSGDEELLREIHMDLSELFTASGDLTVEEREGSIQSFSSELLERAGEYARAALEMAEGAGDLDCLRRVNQCLGTIAYQGGRLTDALKLARAAEKIAREMFFELSALGLMSRIYRRLGDNEMAIQAARDYLAWAESVLDKEERVRAAADLGVALLRNGDLQEAEIILHKADELDRHAHEVSESLDVKIALGEIKEQKGDAVNALLNYRAVVSSRDFDGALATPHEVFMQLGKLLFIRDEYVRARFFLEKVANCDGISPEVARETGLFLAGIAIADEHDRGEASAYMAHRV